MKVKFDEELVKYLKSLPKDRVREIIENAKSKANWLLSMADEYPSMSINEFINDVQPYETLKQYYALIYKVIQSELNPKDVDTLIKIFNRAKEEYSTPQHDKSKTKLINQYHVEFIQNLINKMEADKKMKINISTPPEGLKSIYDAELLNLIFDRLQAKKIVTSGDRTNFLALLTDKPIGTVYWNPIHGAKSGLFDLMQRITGANITAAMLKLRFYSNIDIHDNWKDKTGKHSKLIDKIMEGI